MHDIIFGTVCATLFLWSFHLYHSANHLQEQTAWEEIEGEELAASKLQVAMLYVACIFVAFVAVLSATLV